MRVDGSCSGPPGTYLWRRDVVSSSAAAAPAIKQFLDSLEYFNNQKEQNIFHKAVNKIEVNGESGGGSVKITMNGDGELKKVFIDPSLFKDSKENTKEEI